MARILVDATLKTIHNYLAISTMVKSSYHPEFNDPTANLVIKSNDMISFRIHDFYLKAGR